MKSILTRCKAGFLAFAMSLQMLPVVHGAEGDPDPTPVIGCSCEDMHDLTDWIKLTADLVDSKSGALDEGNYYLENDVKLNRYNIFLENDTITTPLPEYNLCLNGHTLTGNGDGSVIYMEVADLTLYGGDSGTGTITGGSNRSGGGIFARYSTLTISDVEISGNEASNYGAGLFSSISAVSLDNVNVTDNHSTNHGGGASFSTTDLTIENSSFTKNTADSEGGGIYLSGLSEEAVLKNSTVADNSTNDDSGNGIYVTSTTYPLILTEKLTISDQIFLDTGANLAFDNFSLVNDNIPISMTTPDVFTTNALVSYMDYFTSFEEKYFIVKTFDGSNNFDQFAVKEISLNFDNESEVYYEDDTVYVYHIASESQTNSLLAALVAIQTELGTKLGNKYTTAVLDDGTVLNDIYNDEDYLSVTILEQAVQYLAKETGNTVKLTFTVQGKELDLLLISEAVKSFRIFVDEALVNGTVQVQEQIIDDDLNSTFPEITRTETGETVTLTVTPDDHWVVETVTVWQYPNDTLGAEVTPVDPLEKFPGKYSFTMPASEALVKATFKEEEYTVTFDANGGKLLDVDGTTELDFIEKVTGAEWRLVLAIDEELPKPLEQNMLSFMGWFLKNEDGALETEITETTRFKENTTVYAKWSDNPVINLDYQGGESVDNTTTLELDGSGMILDYDNLMPTPPTKEGYEFLGWYTAAEEGVLVEKTTVFKENDVIYAQWEILKYTVTFDFNEKSDPIDSSTTIPVELVEWGTTVAEPEHSVVKDGYMLSDWYYTLANGDYSGYKSEELAKDEDGMTLGVLWDLETDLVYKEFTLYALWEVEEYTVTFDYQDTDLHCVVLGVDDAIDNIERTVEYGEYITDVTNPEHTGYDFVQWYYIVESKDPVNDALVETDTPWHFGTAITGDLEVFAEWDIRTYDITFDFQKTDETEADRVVTTEHFSLLEAPTEDLPTKEGYSMYGWYYEATNFTDVALVDTVFAADGETKIGILWDFETDLVGQVPSAYDAPDPLVDTVDGKLTLYANWDINRYEVTFDYKDSDLIQATPTDPYVEPVRHGDAVKITEDADKMNPSHTGYHFLGWFYDVEVDGVVTATKWDFESIIESHVYVYAMWDILTYEITYVNKFTDDNGDEVEDIVTITADHFDLLVQPESEHTRLSHTQNGWYYIDTTTDGDDDSSPDAGGDEDTAPDAGGDEEDEVVPDYATDDEDDIVGILWNFATDMVGEVPSEYDPADPAVDKVDGKLTLYANWEIHVYDVSLLWDLEGDISVEEDLYDFQKVKYGRYADEPDPAPDRRLYTFLGWHDRDSKVEAEEEEVPPETEEDDGVAVIADDNGIVYIYEEWEFETDAVTRDVVLFADWLKNPTVTLVPIGSESGEIWYEIELTQAFGGHLNLSIETDQKLRIPEREGYKFLGWYTSPTDWTEENKVNETTSTFNNGDSLYGAWEIEEYDIAFGALDLGLVEPPVKYKYGSLIEEPEDDIFVKAGSEIAYWYYIKEDENGNKTKVTWDFAVDTAFADMVLYCEWDTSSWAVTFDFKDEGVTEDAVVLVQHNDQVPMPDPPTRTGYDFVGWYYVNYQESETLWDFKTAITKNYTIYAVWTIQEYTLNFYHNDIYSDDEGSRDTETETLGVVVEYNGVIPEVQPEPSKGVAVFLGWYRDKGTWQQELDITKPMPEILELPVAERVVNLHAKWTEEFDIVLDYQNGQDSITLTTQLNGQLHESLIPPDPTHSNPAYEFKGWYDSPVDGEKINMNQVGGYTFWDDCTIYAQWLVYPTITLVSGEGGSIDSSSFILGTDGILSSDMIATVVTTPEQYYYFRGWYTTIDGDIPVSWGTIYTEDTTIYAQWTRLPIYRISLASGSGGTIGTSFLMTTEDGTLTTDVLNSVVKSPEAGYSFKGWYTTATGTLQVNGSTLFTEDTTIYAQWTQDPPPVYTITLVSTTGGTLGTTFLQTTGTLYQDQLDGVSKSPDAGYAFKGWFTTSTGYIEVDLDRIYTEDTTIYAQWEEVVDAVYSYGIVTDLAGNPAEGVAITLMQNGNIIDTSTTDVMGYYYFYNIYGGYYNILMERGSSKETVAVSLNRMDKNLPTLIFNGYSVSSVLNISTETPVLSVVGLSSLAGIMSSSSSYTLELYVSQTISQLNMESIRSILGQRESIISFFDIDLYKTTYADSSVTEKVSMLETASLLQFVLDIPSEFRGMDGYSVLRIHDGGLDILNETINTYGERIEVSGDGRHLSIYTRNFSTFALIGSTSSQNLPEVEIPPEEEEESYVIYDVGYVQLINGVSASSSSVAGSVEISTVYPMEGDYVYLTPLPNFGYTVEYIYVENNKGESISTSLMSDGSYRFTQGDTKYTVTVNFGSKKVETPVETLFQDVSATDTYCEAINQVVSWGLMSGTSSNTFSPEASLTRGMIVTILHNLSGDRFTGSSRFTDVFITDYYYNSVVWAEDMGIIGGYDDGTFRPHQAINREELAVILDKFCKSQNLQSFVWAFTEDFADQSSISTWAVNSALFCVNEGVMPLVNSYFKPKSQATRGEVAVSLVVIYHLLYN